MKKERRIEVKIYKRRYRKKKEKGKRKKALSGVFP